jgi:DNA-binding NarL/FixJ family response regulator
MKILVIDDHVLIRQAMQGVLKKITRNPLVLEATNSAQAMQIVDGNPDLDLILLDLTLPDRDGFALLAELRERLPHAAIVVLSGVQEPDFVLKALDLGALGYIPKTAQSDVILNALRLVLGGGIYVPPEILARDAPPLSTSQIVRPRVVDSLPAKMGLTERQLEVLALMMEGKSNKTICRMLNLAEPTVKNHVTAILKAFKVSNRTEAVIVASKLGWDLVVVAKS